MQDQLQPSEPVKPELSPAITGPSMTERVNSFTPSGSKAEVSPVIMQAEEAARLAAGGRLWVRLPDAGTYYRCTVSYRGENRHGEPMPMVVFDAGWGSEELEPGELVKVDTGRLA